MGSFRPDRAQVDFTVAEDDSKRMEKISGGTAPQVSEWRRGEFEITTDRDRMDLDTIYAFLALESEWSRGIARAAVERSVRYSLCFGVFHGNKQVGFARVICDCATIAYLGDVFVLTDYRGRGLAKWLMECIVSHPDLQNLRRWILVTGDAHGLYRKHGFTQLASPESFMELHNPGVYKIE
jgi:GNAT superfamily N-acetyltransferase